MPFLPNPNPWKTHFLILITVFLSVFVPAGVLAFFVSCAL